MKITTENTGFMLVKAWDSRDSGTDFAIIRDTDLTLNKITSYQKAREYFKENSIEGGIVMNGDDCDFTEIEKLNPTIYNFIEQSSEDEEWDIRFIDEELYDEIYKTCRIDDIDGPGLQIFGDKLIFQLYSEGGSEGYFLEFCTHYLPVDVFIK